MLFFKLCPVSYNTPYEKIGDEVRSLADEVPFDIPDSWEWVRLGNISSYAETKQKVNATSADPSIWGLDLEDIEKGGRLLEHKTVGERKAVGDKTVFVKGDILYSKLRPYLLKILVAPDDGICTPEIVPFRVYGGINPNYIVNYLKSPYVDNLINSITYGVKMPRVGTETMTSLLVPIPPLEEQLRIVEKIDEVASAVSAYDVAYQKTEALNSTFPEALKKSILQEAVQGKLVPQDPTDESAEALLERIRAEKQRLIKEGKIKKDKHESIIFRRDNSHYEKLDGVESCIDDEIPFEIPDTWAWSRLGSLVEVITSGSRDWAKHYSEKGSLFLRMGNLSRNSFELRLNIQITVGLKGLGCQLCSGEIRNIPIDRGICLTAIRRHIARREPRGCRDLCRSTRFSLLIRRCGRFYHLTWLSFSLA